jgi:endonuclease/exonuclease/phosphatase family metal-dependent hydrolase
MNTPLRVATWNIHAGVGLDRRRRPVRIANVLDAIDADIVALQEAPLDAAMCAMLERDGGYHVVAAPTLRHRGEPFGNALLTRLPLAHSTLVDLSQGRREPRVAINAEVHDAAGRPLRVLATHCGLAGRERLAQIRRLAELLGDDAALPGILLGDFNEPRANGSRLRHLQHAPAPTPPTFPAMLPFLSLDRIFACGGLELRELRTWRGARAWLASDHLPLVAEIHRASPSNLGETKFVSD